MPIKKIWIFGLIILNILSAYFTNGAPVLLILANILLFLVLYFFELSFRAKPIGSLILFTYIQFSLIWAPPIWYYLNNGKELGESFKASYLLGILFQSIIVIFIKIGEKRFLSKKDQVLQPEGRFFLPPNLLLSVFIIFTLITSALSHYLGVSVMGIEKSLQLPYKLEPTLNILRGNIFPLISFLIYLKLEPCKRIQIAFFLYWLAWSLFEVWAKGSKAFLLISFFPIIVFTILKKFKSLKKLSGFFILLVPLFIGNYVIGDYIRENKMNLSTHNIHKKGYLEFVLKEAYFRIFPDAVLIEKFKNYVPEDINLELFRKEKGAPNIHTYIIDKFPRGAPHSSGITGLTDGYLFSGFSGLITSAIFLIITFIFFDYLNPKYESIKVIGITYFFHTLILGEGLLSYFFFRNPLTFLAPILASIFAHTALRTIRIQPIRNSS